MIFISMTGVICLNLSKNVLPYSYAYFKSFTKTYHYLQFAIQFYSLFSNHQIKPYFYLSSITVVSLEDLDQIIISFIMVIRCIENVKDLREQHIFDEVDLITAEIVDVGLKLILLLRIMLIFIQGLFVEVGGCIGGLGV